MAAAELYAELYDYDTLEAAFEAAFPYLDHPPEDSEPWLINLQNHLIWRSYEPGKDPDMDCVVLSGVSILLKRHSLTGRDVTSPELPGLLTT